ncbi:MAG: hypothetical protein AAF587_11080 [Bacteroidota bacterium]
MLSEYTIDRNNVIFDINEGFLQFGQENGATFVDPQTWIGQDLLRIVQGDTTRMYYHVLFKRVRLTEKQIELPYRCDSPTQARFMRMRLSCDKDLHIHFENEIEAIVPFERPISLMYHSKGVIKRCSICNRLGINLVWTDPLKIHELPLDFDAIWKISYDICPKCLADVKKLYVN